MYWHFMYFFLDTMFYCTIPDDNHIPRHWLNNVVSGLPLILPLHNLFPRQLLRHLPHPLSKNLFLLLISLRSKHLPHRLRQAQIPDTCPRLSLRIELRFIFKHLLDLLSHLLFRDYEIPGAHVEFVKVIPTSSFHFCMAGLIVSSLLGNVCGTVLRTRKIETSCSL